MNDWSETANVRFVETASVPAQVRIAFRPEEIFGSYLGTEILTVSADKSTMNLGSLSMDTSDEEFKRVVWHEAGHTLGFPHEHFRPEICSRIDREKAIMYFWKTQGWERQTTIDQVLTCLENSALIATSLPDPKSIMCYPLPAQIMTDGKGVAGGMVIDETDRQFAASLYTRKAELLGATIGTGGNRNPRVYYFTKYGPLSPRSKNPEPDGHIHELAWFGGRWSHRDITADAGNDAVVATTGSPIAAVGRGLNLDPRVYYLSEDNSVQELSWFSGGDRWTHRDVSAAASADPASPWSSLAAMGCGYYRSTAGLDPRIYYMSANGNIHELGWFTDRGRWEHRDATAAAGGVIAKTASAIAALGSGVNLDPRVYYLDDGNHVQELAWADGLWSHRDVTADAGGVAARTDSPIAAVGSGDGRNPRIYYFDADGRVQELAWVSGAWSHRNVTTDADGVAAATGSPLAAIGSGNDRIPRIYYLSADRHVRELAWVGGAWSHRDVTIEASGFAAVAKASIAAMAGGPSLDPRVYYLSLDYQVQELAWDGSWSQRPALGA